MCVCGTRFLSHTVCRPYLLAGFSLRPSKFFKARPTVEYTCLGWLDEPSALLVEIPTDFFFLLHIFFFRTKIHRAIEAKDSEGIHFMKKKIICIVNAVTWHTLFFKKKKKMLVWTISELYIEWVPEPVTLKIPLHVFLPCIINFSALYFILLYLFIYFFILSLLINQWIIFIMFSIDSSKYEYLFG